MRVSLGLLFSSLLLLGSCKSDPVPARKVLHRLNRAEYNNTVRDLFGTALRPADDFPADDFALGFDNQAHALSISPLHLEMYDRAADTLLDELFVVGDVPPQRWVFETEGSEVLADVGAVWDSTAWVLWTEGAVRSVLWVEEAGEYTIAADAMAEQAGEELARMSIRVDGAEVAAFDVEASYVEGRPIEMASYEVRIPLSQGRHDLSVAYVNEYKHPPDEDRNLIVDRFAVEGPLDVARQPQPGRARVLVCDPAEVGEAACAESIVRTFGRRAWRRPLTDLEFERKMHLYSQARTVGADWQEAVRTVLKAFMVSPHFVYRVETAAQPGAGHELSGLELASRLSYFLWSSTPDDRLIDLGLTGALRDPDVLEAEARRMMEDDRADALIENFGGLWLGIRKLDDAAPSVALFPEWDEGLRASMRDEMIAFARQVLLQDRSVYELLTTTETVVDARLAEHYGLPDGAPLAPETVDIPERMGWIARGGLLTAFAHPTETAPVLRGKWVLEKLMCSPPPPPPDGVDLTVDGEPEGVDNLTRREELERHRADPSCAGCHVDMDAIGFGMDGFDAIGRARATDEAGRPLDLTGALTGLGTFDGVQELAGLLAQDERIRACTVEHAFTYAMGRPPTDADHDTMVTLEGAFATSGFRFRELVVSLVRSRPFRVQGPDVASEES